MRLKTSLIFSALTLIGTIVGLPGISHAHRSFGGQVCSLGTADVGQPGTLICKNIFTGSTTQTIEVGPTVSAAGGIGGSLARAGDRVLVTNQADGALLFKEVGARLKWPTKLDTNGEGSLSGAVSANGAYVLTGKQLRFFANGQTRPSSSEPLLRGDGSAAQVTLTDHYAYVSEKSGSLEAFALGRDGNIVGKAVAVQGVMPGTIVGITGFDDLVVAPIAHLASDFDRAAITVAAGLKQVQLVATKETAACWSANEDGQVCVTNPGSMTVSCGRLGADAFDSYTSAAVSLSGESAFDLAMRDNLVGLQAVHDGVPVLLTYTRSDHSDFLTFVSEFPLGTAKAAGALLLPPLR
jgi:hypothetical protein